MTRLVGLKGASVAMIKNSNEKVVGVVYDHNGRRTIYPDKPSVIIKFKTPEALMEYMLSLETERRIISKDEMSFSQHVWLYKGLIFNHKSNRVIKVLVSEHK